MLTGKFSDISKKCTVFAFRARFRTKLLFLDCWTKKIKASDLPKGRYQFTNLHCVISLGLNIQQHCREKIESHIWHILNNKIIINSIINLIKLSYLTLRRLMSYIYMEHPFLMFLDHTQRRSTVGRTSLDE